MCARVVCGCHHEPPPRDRPEKHWEHLFFFSGQCVSFKNPTIREDFFDYRGGRLWCVTCERGLGQLDNIYIYIYIYIDRYIYIYTHIEEKSYFFCSFVQ